MDTNKDKDKIEEIEEDEIPYAHCCGGSVIKNKGDKCPICGDTWD